MRVRGEGGQGRCEQRSDMGWGVRMDVNEELAFL